MKCSKIVRSNWRVDSSKTTGQTIKDLDLNGLSLNMHYAWALWNHLIRIAESTSEKKKFWLL